MRVLAIGDIHGCLGPLDDLLKWVVPTRDDLVITLGDYVDRGPDSRGVLNRFIELKQQLNMICLRGNHEVMMVEAWRGGKPEKKMWLDVGGFQTLGSYGQFPGRTGALEDVPKEHWEFLENGLVDYYETELFIYVHATVVYDLPMEEQTPDALFWDFLPETMRHISKKTVICGHTSQKTGEPKVVPGAVCIDTYAYGSGWLTCLDTISGRYWQTDMLGRKREGYLDYEE
jgi:serine/threonine protein phosphatase 1